MSHNRRIDTIRSHLGASQIVTDAVCPSTTSAEVIQAGILQDQVAIITGSGQGIGAATAILFAKAGAHVVVTDLDANKANAVVDQIKNSGGVAFAIPGDVTDPKFPSHIISETIKKFGKLNILVNNAGYTWDGVIHKMTDKQWEAMYLVHCTAPFRLIREAAPYMRDASKQEMDQGKTPQNRVIINISSTSGLHGNFGQANYSTAKLGIIGLTKTVAKEWGAFGVRCNAVAFGYIDTRLTRAKEGGESIEVDGKKIALGIPQQNLTDKARFASTPLGRSGTAEEAAGGILVMASPFSAYITGHCLEVTGGAGI